MELRPMCATCNGLDKCNKFCDKHLGTNLVNFINGIDVIETAIGDFRENARTKKIEYIISGHILENSSNPTYILSDLSTSIDASGKFISCSGKTPQQILRAYLDTLDMPAEAKTNTMNTFKKFNSSKLLPVPLKPGSECEITYTDNNDKKVVRDARIGSINWNSDKESRKLKCTILCTVEKTGIFDNGSKVIKIPITDYGDKIRLPQIERTLKSSEIDRDLIHMTDVGFIKPIEVADDKYKLAIDNSYLYRIVDSRVFVIGTWRNGKLVAIENGIEPIAKSKAYKKIHNALGYIDKHRRYIVPYGLFEINSIKV